MTAPPAGGDRLTRVLRILFLLLAGGGILYLGHRLRAILTPLLVALLLAYIWNPLVTRLEKQGVRRVFSIASIYVLFYGAVAAVLLFGAPVLVNQGVDLVQELFVGEPLLVDVNGNGVLDEGDKAADWNGNGIQDGPKIRRLIEWSQERLTRLTGSPDFALTLSQLREKAKGHEGEIAKALAGTGRTLLTWLTASFDGFMTVVSYVVLVPVYMFFLLMNMNAWWEKARALIPPAIRPRALATLDRIHKANSAFFRGQATISLIEGLIVWIVLWILGVRFSFLFGALYCVVSMIPFIGVTVGFGATALFTFLDAGGFGTAFFLVVGLFVGIQVLESALLQPLILGRETGLHPIAVILSIFIFGDLLGFFGVLLAIPLISASIIMVEEYVLPTLRSVTGEPGPASARVPAP